jgi:hypothetical protein
VINVQIKHFHIYLKKSSIACNAIIPANNAMALSIIIVFNAKGTEETKTNNLNDKFAYVILI